MDRVNFIFRILLSLAKAVKEKENEQFLRLKRVVLSCHEPGGVMALIVDPFASLFAEGGVELVLMAREG